MKFTVRALALHREIAVPASGRAADGTIAILPYRSLVARGNLEPVRADHLVRDDAASNAAIPTGRYLFTQGISTVGERAALEPGRTEAEAEWLDAAEAVWLESLWRDERFANDRLFVRLLTEDGKTVFQIFRELEGRE